MSKKQICSLQPMQVKSSAGGFQKQTYLDMLSGKKSLTFHSFHLFLVAERQMVAKLLAP